MASGGGDADKPPVRELFSGTQLEAVLRPQHVTTIKDSASVDQALRVRRGGGGCRRWRGGGGGR